MSWLLMSASTGSDHVFSLCFCCFPHAYEKREQRGETTFYYALKKPPQEAGPLGPGPLGLILGLALLGSGPLVPILGLAPLGPFQ